MLKLIFGSLNFFAGQKIMSMLLKKLINWSRRFKLDGSVALDGLTWQQAETLLKQDTIVVIPLGAQSKEHGPHLRLDNDFQLAEYLKTKVMERVTAVFAPTVNYGFYPAFVEYPGSITLSLETARDMIVDICISLSRFGPKRFYVLNTGISTLKPLKAAGEILDKKGILLAFTDLSTALTEVESKVSKQKGGSHADEIETSMMLYINPDLVQMHKATADFRENAKGPLTRIDSPEASYSPSGVWGDATLATKAKGAVVVNALVDSIVEDIEQVGKMNPPERID